MVDTAMLAMVAITMQYIATGSRSTPASAMVMMLLLLDP
jgi:hypothetical protein